MCVSGWLKYAKHTSTSLFPACCRTHQTVLELAVIGKFDKQNNLTSLPTVLYLRLISYHKALTWGRDIGKQHKGKVEKANRVKLSISFKWFNYSNLFCRDMLVSRTSHLKNGLNRLFSLVPYEVITTEIWDYVMPHWLEAIVKDVPEKEMFELKLPLRWVVLRNISEVRLIFYKIVLLHF